MTEDRLFELMEKAEEKIREALEGTDFYIDDTGWGTNCFRIGVWKWEADKPIKATEVDHFFYLYNDECDAYYGTDEKQLEKQLESFLIDFEQEH